MDYIAYLHNDRKSDFGVSFPDFPGCITAGKTLEEARQNAAQALALHISGMLEDAETIPEPSTLDAIADDPARKDAVAILITLKQNAIHLAKTVRVNITARESQIAEIDRRAEQAGMTRSAYFVQAAIRGTVIRNPTRRSLRSPAAKRTASTRK